MVPLYGRIADLGPGDLVVVKCGACNHSGLIHPAALPAKPLDPRGLPSLGLRPDERVIDLLPDSDAASGI
jgi:hypothetical protein